MSTRVTKSVNKWLNFAHFSLLPGTCIVCRKCTWRDFDLCAECEASLPCLKSPCVQCGLPLPPGYKGIHCGTCLVCPPPWSRFIAPFTYKPPLSYLISTFKYQARLVNGRVLTHLLLNHLLPAYQGRKRPSLIIPVPLHGSRLRQRGFNQALEMCRWLSPALNIPVDRHLLVRHKATKQQTGLSAFERKNNIRTAFRLKPGSCISPETTVAIVDDVVTTGITATELAKQLKKAGAQEIHVWSLARTVL